MFEFHLVDIGLTIINLLVLFLILRHFFWKPVSAFLEKRRQGINDDLDSARRDREEAEQLLAEHRKLIATNKEEAAKIINAAIHQGDLRKDEIIAQAGQEAAVLIERAKIEIAQERTKAVEELRAEISQLAIMVAEKMLTRSLTAEDREAIFAAALEEVDTHVN